MASREPIHTGTAARAWAPLLVASDAAGELVASAAGAVLLPRAAASACWRNGQACTLRCGPAQTRVMAATASPLWVLSTSIHTRNRVCSPFWRVQPTIGPVRGKLLESGAVKWNDLWDKKTGLPYTLEQLG